MSELDDLIAEQKKDDTNLIQPERNPGSRFNTLSLDAGSGEWNDVSSGEWMSGVIYDFEEMIDQQDYELGGMVVSSREMNPSVRRGICLVRIPHGTSNGYQNYKCRCQDCRNAWSEWTRGAIERRKQRGIPAHMHGKYTTYKNHGCRCDACRAAGNTYSAKQKRAWRATRKKVAA